jgi:hypothetical protein
MPLIGLLSGIRRGGGADGRFFSPPRPETGFFAKVAAVWARAGEPTLFGVTKTRQAADQLDILKLEVDWRELIKRSLQKEETEARVAQLTF